MSRILTPDDRIVVSKVLYAETLAERSRGLLGRTELPQNTGMLIRPCRSIHMWFMQFPIDAAFLDCDLRILKIARHLRPWQLAFAPRKTYCVLETAVDVLQSLHSGDLLLLEEK